MFNFSRTWTWTWKKKFNCPRIFKKSTKWRNSYYVLYNNNFFYAQLASFLVPQKDFYYVHNDTEMSVLKREKNL